MAYDILLHQMGPVVLEMSYTFPLSSSFSDHWTRDLESNDSNIRPEEAQVDIFLERIRDMKTVAHLQ